MSRNDLRGAVERLEEDLGTALVPTWVVDRVRSLLADDEIWRP